MPVVKSRKRQRGQSILELALVLPIALLILLGGASFGLAIMGASQMQMAAFHGASAAARTDPGGSANSSTIGDTTCPTGVAEAATAAAYQSLNTKGSADTVGAENIYGVIPLSSINVTVACSNGFDRSTTDTCVGTGDPNQVTVTVTGKIDIAFIPFADVISVQQQQTADVMPYRSRSEADGINPGCPPGAQ